MRAPFFKIAGAEIIACHIEQPCRKTEGEKDDIIARKTNNAARFVVLLITFVMPFASFRRIWATPIRRRMRNVPVPGP